MGPIVERAEREGRDPEADPEYSKLAHVLGLIQAEEARLHVLEDERFAEAEEQSRAKWPRLPGDP